MPKSARRFSGLMGPPEPLPDEESEPRDQDEATAGERAAVIPLGEPVTDVGAAMPESPGALEPASALSHDTPPPADVGKRAAGKEADMQADKPVVPTIRLHQPSARALRSAWLQERRIGDPTLSFPTFASEIVALGLVAYERKMKRRSQS